ncbi:MAG: cytochrome P460 family protein [Deltaproteobacteria bacterium]|nr:cytochrome P460 family protein [Deltaproteobacteria bacterium]
MIPSRPPCPLRSGVRGRGGPTMCIDLRSPLRVLVAALAWLILAAPAGAACTGDCNGSGTVDVSKLIRGVNIALGNAPVSECPAFDPNGDGAVTVNELIAAVNAALTGCPIEPIFPANYRDTFVEVRDCRNSVEHGSVSIRVLVNPESAAAYQRNENPLPLGTTVVKEEFDGPDCSNDAELVRWRPMRKEAPGFDPDDGDWAWQWVDAPSRSVRFNDKATCIGCHRAEACLARDYMCTENGPDQRGVLRPVLEQLPAALLSIGGSAPSDVLAVGADPHDGRGPYIVHYDGSAWTRLDSGASGDLWWITQTPIAGSYYLAGAGGLILQLDAVTHAFTRHETPAAPTLFGIWGPAANDLWAVGGDDDGNGVAWRYDGERWSAQDLSGVREGGVPTLFKVWGRSATDVYAVGEVGVVLHYDGARWTALDSGVTRTLFTVHGNDSALAVVGGFFSGVLLEQQPSGAFLSRAPTGVAQLNGVFFPPDGAAVAVGNGLQVAVRDGAGWSIAAPGDDDQLRDFHAVWVDPSGDIWAVGGDLSVSLSNGILAHGGTTAVIGGPVR